MLPLCKCRCVLASEGILLTNPSSPEDGKEMNLDLSNMRITEVMEQVDRHSRMLARKEELTGN